MYKMIKGILAITIIMVMATPTLKAHGIKPPDPRVKYPKQTAEEKAKTLTDTISSIVNLTAVQYPKVYASNLKYVSEKERIKAAGGESAKTEILSASKTRKQEIAEVLTAEQKAKWLTWKKARRAILQGEKDNKTPQSNSPGIPLDDIDGM